MGKTYKPRVSKSPSHRKGDGKKANAAKFAGVPVAVVERLNRTLERNQRRALSAEEREALVLYWETRLCNMGESMERGRNGDLLLYRHEAAVLDSDAHKTNRVITRERSDD